MPSDFELEYRAKSAYYRRPLEGLEMKQEPGDCTALDYEGKKYVVLSNIRGVLAVYRVRNDGMLKGLKRWPVALAEAAGIPA